MLSKKKSGSNGFRWWKRLRCEPILVTLPNANGDGVLSEEIAHSVAN